MSRLQILRGDCLDEMEWMADETVQCCITSPPYFGLRDYGVEGQIGLEETPEQYVRKMVEVFREVRRVLKPDGTLWLNLGDSYCGGGQGPGSAGSKQKTNQGSLKPPFKIPAGYKNKDIIGIPWMVAFALRADGWYLRQDIIWHKPNPMPESVRDRCTKAHEYIFLLTKSERYYFDGDAIKEPVEKVQPPRRFGRKEYETAQSSGGHKAARAVALATGQGTESSMGNHYGRVFGGDTHRNRRSVWKVPIRPYKGAHFATYPPDLIEPCVLAGSRRNDVVFDPFGGSGTTAAVALRHGRRAITCELNPEYVELIKRRTSVAMIEYDEEL